MLNISVLSNCCLFKGLDSSEIVKLLSSISDIKTKNLQRDEFVFVQDEPITYMGILISGELESKKITPCGRILNLCIKKPGEIFAHAYLFNDYIYSPVEVSAVVPSKICIFDKRDIIKLMQNDHTFLHNFLCAISETCCFLNQRIDILSHHSIKKKAVHFILNHCELQKENKCSYVILPFSKKIWAYTINVSRSSLCRELSKLEDDSLIRVDNRKIYILNMEGLKNILMS